MELVVLRMLDTVQDFSEENIRAAQGVVTAKDRWVHGATCYGSIQRYFSRTLSIEEITFAPGYRYVIVPIFTFAKEDTHLREFPYTVLLYSSQDIKKTTKQVRVLKKQAWCGFDRFGSYHRSPGDKVQTHVNDIGMDRRWSNY